MIKSFKLFEALQQQYVVDINSGGVPQAVHDYIYELARQRGYHNHSYIEYYVCDEYKPVDEVKNPSDIIIQDNGYCYEKGDSVVSDWLLDEGLKPGDKVIFKIWW